MLGLVRNLASGEVTIKAGYKIVCPDKVGDLNLRIMESGGSMEF